MGTRKAVAAFHLVPFALWSIANVHCGEGFEVLDVGKATTHRCVGCTLHTGV